MARGRWQGLWIAVLMVVLWGLGGQPVGAIAERDVPPLVIEQVQEFLAQATPFAPAQMQIQQVNAVTWHDACLELAQPGELCAQVLTPGYAVTVETPKGTMHLHTNQAGTEIRPEPRARTDVPVNRPVLPPQG